VKIVRYRREIFLVKLFSTTLVILVIEATSNYAKCNLYNNFG